MAKKKSSVSLKADKRIRKIPGGVKVLSYAKLNLYLEILKLLSYVKSSNCKLFYCSTGTWNYETSCATTIEKKKEILKSTGNFKNKTDIVEIIPVDNEKLRKLFDRANQPLNTEFTFSRKIALKEINKVRESYIGILPFKEYKEVIIDSASGKLKPLFYDNVRDFLGIDEEVNDKINRTLQEKTGRHLEPRPLGRQPGRVENGVGRRRVWIVL